MNIDKILNYLPHRYPLLLVDRVLEFKKAKFIKAFKNISISDPFFIGHFPKKPIMPGVLIIEALAQAAGILAYKTTNWDPLNTVFYLASIDKVKFKRIVIPGDKLLLNICVKQARSSAWKFIGKSYVDNNIVCSAEITCLEGSFEND